MSPLFYEDSMGAKLAEKAAEAMDRARDADGDPVEDHEALEHAETEVRAGRPDDQYEQLTSDWVPVVRPSVISGILGPPGISAMMLTSPLDSEGIEYVWAPYPPESMPLFRPSGGAFDRPFWILVPAASFQDARVLLGGLRDSELPMFSRRSPSLPERSTDQRIKLWFAVLLFGGSLLPLIALVWVVSQLFEHFTNQCPPRIGVS